MAAGKYKAKELYIVGWHSPIDREIIMFGLPFPYPMRYDEAEIALQVANENRKPTFPEFKLFKIDIEEV